MTRIIPFFILFVCSIAILHSEEPPCFRDIEKNFFRPDFVDQALSIHNVSQSTWRAINVRLQENAAHVPVMVKQRAAAMPRNPFNAPFQRDVAGELVRQVLFEVFKSSLADYNLTNASDVSQMFRYIRDRQSLLLYNCFGEGELEPPEPESPLPNSSPQRK